MKRLFFALWPNDKVRKQINSFNGSIPSTLARKARKRIDTKAISMEWPVQSFCLVESCSTMDGVRYQVLQRWNFN